MRPQSRLHCHPRPLGFSLARLSSAAAVCAALLAGAGAAHAASLYWDPLVDGDGNLGGSGSWDLLGTFWDTNPVDPVGSSVWSNLATDTAVFRNTSGTAPFNVTVATIAAGGVQFDAAGYRLSGGTLTMGGGTVTTNVSGRIDSVITGAGGLIANGLAGTTLVLGGANTFTGQLLVNSGTVALAGLAAGPATGGVGNETVVASGATLNLGGQAYGNLAPAGPFEIFRIAGTGDGGVGALINQGASQINATSKVVLTANATVNTGGDISTSYNAGGQIITSAGGRFDVRLNAAPTAGQSHLDLAGFTLTKKGANLLALVNADVSSGNIVVDEGQLNLEVGTLVQGAGTITVNPNGKLGFFSITAAGNISRQIVVNGGTIGDPTSTSAAQTIGAPIQATGALNPNFTAISANRTTLSGQITESSFTGTGFAKRGGGLLAFSNIANTFNAPVTIYAGTLGADFTTTLAGGVPLAAAVTSTDTPLGTNGTITLAGGTLNIRANMANDATQQYFDLQRNIVIDRAPSGMTFDRIANATQTDKHVRITSLTMQPASVANGWSIGQNQLTFTQANTHRLDLPLLTMNSDSVVTTGDHTFSGNILSANRNSLVRTGANTTQFVTAGTQQFNAYFNTSGNLRVGSGFGTPITDNTVTVSTGSIYIAPASLATWRTPTNLAAGNLIEVVSQRVAHGVVNFEQFTSVPANLRTVTSGVLGVGSATAFGNIDLNKLGDGTWRIGSAFTGSGNGTITGTIAAGAGRLVRLGAGAAVGSVVTVSATNAISGMVGLEVGSPLINAVQTTSGTGTVLLTSANNYMAGTTVNRSATLRFENNGSIGTGTVNVFGTIAAQQTGGTFTLDGLTNTIATNLYGGSTLSLDNSAVTTSTPVNRWGDTAPINLTASGLTYASPNNAVVSTGETVGAITFSGGSNLTVNRTQLPTSGHLAILNAASLTRSGQGTLELVRNGGNGAGFTGGQRIIVNSGAPVPVNGMVSPYYVINGVTEQNTFATYGANGFLPVTYTRTIHAGTTAGIFDTGLLAGTDLVFADFASTNTTLTLGDNPIIYALRVGAGTAGTTIATSGANTTITLRSGGLVISGDSSAGNFSTAASTATINPNLVFNSGAGVIEAVINARTGYTGVLNGQVTAAGLSKFGAGTLNMTANQTTLTGTVSVNQGTLQLFGPTATGTFNSGGTGLIQLNGGQLNLRSNNSAVTGTINPTMQNGLSVAANIPIATVDLNRATLDVASSGTFIFNPAAAGSTGLQLLGSPGVQGQTLTVSGANYALQFGANAVNSFAGNVTINNAVTLTLDNSPVVTGTNPVITKSGAGTLIVARVTGGTAIASGTTAVVNAGTLELRSLTSLGTGLQTAIVLNAGTLNMRRDTTGGTYGGTGTGYPVTVNGSAIISADRFSAGSNQNLGLGRLTVNTNGTVTINNGNGFYPSFAGAQLNGTAFIVSNVAAGDQEASARFLGGSDVSGGALVKLGTGHLHLLNSNSTYDGGTYAQAGTLRLRATNAAGTGPVYLNPGGTIDFNSASNLGATQPLIVRGNGAFIPMISVNVDGVSHPTVNVDATNAPVGVVGISNGTAGSYFGPVNLSALYGGGWSFGGVSSGAYDPVFTGDTLTVGNNNLYRLGGGGTSFAMGVDTGRVARFNVLTGPNNVRLGFDSSNILPVNMTNFQYSIAGVNDYSGGLTVIHRGMVARLFSNNDGTRSGFSDSNINVFGVLSLSGQASLDNGASNVNGVTLHPGSALFFDNQNGAANGAADLAGANVANRFNDAMPIALNGAMINLIGANIAVSSELVGDVTYSRGARLRAQLTGAGGTATLSLNNLFGAGPGNTLTLATSAAGTLGAADKIIVVNSPPVSTNGMVTPSIVNLSDNTFVTHGVNGFANIAYDKSLNATYTANTLLPTDKVDVITAALTLTDNPTVYALRTSQTINVGGPFNSITLRSGGLIGTGGTINPNLVFNNGGGNIEARIFTTNTLTLAGTITANGVTKFGAGNLTVAVPQPNYASGWTVNSGTLQINDLQGLGQSVPGNGVTLNGALTTGGLASQAFGQTTLNFNRDDGSPETMVFTGGPITVINEGTIRMGSVSNDRNILIPAITLDSTGTDSRVSLTLDVPFSRVRHGTTNLTLLDDAIVRVQDAGSTADTGRVVAAYANALTGTGKNLTKIGNRTFELPNDNSATFTGGTITVSQGTLRVRHNGSLGDATSATTIERNATLEIDAASFAPIATVTQLPGSIERWDRDGVRASGYNLPAGVNLQLNTNVLTAAAYGLNGGTIEAFLWTDHPATGVERTIGSGVTVNLLASSYVGQNILQGLGYDAGRLPAVGQPFADNINSAYLRIDGPIVGPTFDLTKTGNDTVTLASTGNTYRNTTVEMGVLRIGATNALPIAGVLTTRTGGTFDLYGFDQSVIGLGTLDGGPNPGGVGVGSAGRVINSGVTDNTLTVTGAANYTYNGSLGLNAALTKTGTGTLTLAGNNTHRGLTTVSNGSLVLNATGFNAIEGNLVKDKTADILVNGGTLLWNASHQIGDLISINLTSGTVNINGKSETFYDFTNSGGLFITGVGGVTNIPDPTLSGGITTLNADSVNTWGTLNISGGSNTVQGQAGPAAGSVGGAILNVGANGGVNFSGTASPNLTVNSDAASGGKVVLEGNIASAVTAGQASITNAGIGGSKGTLNLNGAARTVSVADGTATVDLLISTDIAGGVGASLTKTGAGRLALDGAQNYLLLTTNVGKTDVNGAFTGGTATVNANAITNFTVSQTLAALNIANGVVVTLGNPPPAAPGAAGDGDDTGFAALGADLGANAPAVQGVPEPGTATLLLGGLATMLGLRRRRA